MLVYRKDMVEVMLHLPHDGTESWQKAPQHVPNVHVFESVIGALWHRENLHKHRLVRRILTESLINRRHSMPERTQQTRCVATRISAVVVLVEGAQNGRGVSRVDLVVHNVEFVPMHHKSGIFSGRRFCSHFPEDFIREGLQLNHRELHHRTRIEVVALHEGF